MLDAKFFDCDSDKFGLDANPDLLDTNIISFNSRDICDLFMRVHMCCDFGKYRYWKIHAVDYAVRRRADYFDGAFRDGASGTDAYREGYIWLSSLIISDDCCDGNINDKIYDFTPRNWSRQRANIPGFSNAPPFQFFPNAQVPDEFIGLAPGVKVYSATANLFDDDPTTTAFYTVNNSSRYLEFWIDFGPDTPNKIESIRQERPAERLGGFGITAYSLSARNSQDEDWEFIKRVVEDDCCCGEFVNDLGERDERTIITPCAMGTMLFLTTRKGSPSTQAFIQPDFRYMKNGDSVLLMFYDIDPSDQNRTPPEPAGTNQQVEWDFYQTIYWINGSVAVPDTYGYETSAPGKEVYVVKIWKAGDGYYGEIIGLATAPPELLPE